MSKLTEGFIKLSDKFKNQSKRTKTAVIISVVALIIAIATFIIYSSRESYGLLFSELDSKDAQSITKVLEDKKVEFKVKSSSIYVPKEMVDALRLELASNITMGSTGFELMDESNSFGMTDEEFQIKKLRMLQGEIERTIKSFPQINNARVHITQAKESVFIKESTPGKAAVYLELQEGETLDAEQVKSIIALVSGSADNIPKQNIEVIDDKMNLLSKDIFDENGEEKHSSTGLESNQAVERAFEMELENKLRSMLEKVLGKDKVSVTVNADLDFDSRQRTEVVFDPNKVIVSESYIRQIQGQNGGNSSNSPVDNQMGNTTPDEDGAEGEIINEERTTNYEVGKTETQTISAPGEIKRLTSSVVIDGERNVQTIQDIKAITAGALGISDARGDEVTVVGMDFDTTDRKAMEEQIAQMKEQSLKEEKLKLYKTIGLIALGVIGIIVIIIILVKIFKKDNEEDVLLTPRLDTVIGGDVPIKPIENFEPITFEEENQKTHMEKEIKGYAQKKPDQVVDIIKAWLTEDER